MQLASASMFAQLISLAVMPIITRLHTPDSLGKYQFFTTLALLITPFVSGSLALAIKSSSSNFRALVNLKLAMQFSLIWLIALLLTLPFFVYLLSESSMDWLIFYLPVLYIFVYLSANFQFAMGLLTNYRQYGNQSTYTVTKSVISNILKLAFSFLSKSGFSLVLALVITEIFQLIRVVWLNYKSIFRFLLKFKWSIFKRSLVQAKVYPTYVTLASVLGVLMNWFPVLTTGVLYGPEFAGLLGLAFMVVNTPVYPFIGALQSICFGELAREKVPAKFISVYGKSMCIALIPSILGLFILGNYGEELFIIVFGEKWRIAGTYAFICFIPISLSFILSPVYSTLNHFFSFQKIFFWINGLSLLTGLLITSFIGYNSFDFKWFIISFSLIMSVSHLVLFSVSLVLTLYKLR